MHACYIHMSCNTINSTTCYLELQLGRPRQQRPLDCVGVYCQLQRINRVHIQLNYDARITAACGARCGVFTQYSMWYVMQTWSSAW